MERNGASASQVSSPSIHLAVLAGDVERTRALAQQDPGAVHALCKGGFLPAQLAVQFCRAGTLPVLLQHGADVRAVDQHGDTLLHLAAVASDHAACAALLDTGRYQGHEGKLLLDAKNPAMFTPLARAVHHDCTAQVRKA